METHPSEERFGPLHLIRCLGELCLMYAEEKLRDVLEAADNAMDVWGDDGSL